MAYGDNPMADRGIHEVADSGGGKGAGAGGTETAEPEAMKPEAVEPEATAGSEGTGRGAATVATFVNPIDSGVTPTASSARQNMGGSLGFGCCNDPG